MESVSDLRAKFLKRYQILPDGCWYWLATKDENGYGRCWFQGKLHKAHRISLFLFRGFDLYSPELGCHHCDNQFCVNPDHLFVGTHKDNVQDCIRKGRFRRKVRSLNPVLIRNYQERAKGMDNPRAKLTEYDVQWIRQNIHNPYTTKELAEKYGVHTCTISRIVRGARWGHLSPEANHGRSVTR